MKLVRIPNYDEYRLDAMFNCYKWDPEFYDSNTLAKYVLVLSKKEDEELSKITESIDRETIESEKYLNKNLKYAKKLYLPKKINKDLKMMSNYESDKHIRLMRYDFHPTVQNNWAVSEVNSDVPGGFAEATLLPDLAKKYLGCNYSFKRFGDILVDNISNKVNKNGTIALVHCTSYSDDRQVMQYLGDKLESNGYKVVYCAADHVRFKNLEAYCILNNNECKLDGIFRFTPLEWLKDIKPKKWDGYFNTITPSCNHPIAIFAQTKRFPLIWDILEKNGIKLTNWRKYLPETREVKEIKHDDSYIFKPACGRVGEKISIKEACREDEYKKILNDVKLHKKNYLAQKKFESKPIIDENGKEFHVCVGSYTIEGKHAGYYARISEYPRIDSYAQDIPVLIEEDIKQKDERNVYSGDDNSFIKKIYKIWSPVDVQWSNWVRPVPFVNIDKISNNDYISYFKIPEINIDKNFFDNSAIIVDFPDVSSMEMGLAFIKYGFRPIPIYNGTVEQNNSIPTTNNKTISSALILGAKELEKNNILDNDKPAFLIDSCRMNRYKMNESIFDNSWDIYGQDLPSYNYLKDKKINRIIVVCNKFHRDLRKILYKFQKHGFEILLTDGYTTPKKVKVKRDFKDVLDKDL